MFVFDDGGWMCAKQHHATLPSVLYCNCTSSNTESEPRGKEEEEEEGGSSALTWSMNDTVIGPAAPGKEGR